MISGNIKYESNAEALLGLGLREGKEELERVGDRYHLPINSRK